MHGARYYCVSLIGVGLALCGSAQAQRAAEPKTREQLFASYGFEPAELSRFYSSLKSVANQPVDVLIVADSLARGFGLPYPEQQAWPHIMAKQLRAAWNPPGVPGGLGFSPVRFDWAIQAPAFSVTGGGAAQWSRYMRSTGNTALRINSPQSNTARIHWNSSGVTSVDSVSYRIQFEHSIAPYNLSNDGAPVNSGEIINSEAMPPEISNFHRLNQQLLDPTKPASITFSPPQRAYFRLSGVVCYNGDESRGIRVQNLACSGISLFDSLGDNGYFDGNEAGRESPLSRDVLRANVDIWGNGKLVYIALGTNDQGVYGRTELEASTTGRAIFRRHLFQFCRHVINSGRDVILGVMPAPGSGRESKYRAMIGPVVHEVADALPHVTTIDFDRALGYLPRPMLPSGWDHGDQLHYTATAHQYFGNEMARLLLLGEPR